MVLHGKNPTSFDSFPPAKTSAGPPQKALGPLQSIPLDSPLGESMGGEDGTGSCQLPLASGTSDTRDRGFVVKELSAIRVPR